MLRPLGDRGPAVADARERKGDGGIFYNYCRQSGLWPKAVSGWDPRKESEKFFPFMPVKNVTREYPPTVLIHGTADTDVPLEQSRTSTSCSCGPLPRPARPRVQCRIVNALQIQSKRDLHYGIDGLGDTG